jgi:DNA-binding IclR family transcriptional regulator
MLREAESADDRNRAGRTMRHRLEHRTVCLDRYHDRQGLEVRFGSVGGSLALARSAAPSVLQAWRSAAELDLPLARHVIAPTPKRCVNRKKLKPDRKPIRLRRDERVKSEVVEGPTAMTGTPLHRHIQPRGARTSPARRRNRRDGPVHRRPSSEPCNHLRAPAG